MTADAIPSLSATRTSRSLPLRFALRELRGGLRGFYVFLACIALGCMAIAGVGSLAASLNDGLAREGQVILGGDVAFTLIQRQAKPDELAFLEKHGTVSRDATLRAMARTANGQATLVELKAVDHAYPLFGTVTLDPAGALDEALAAHGGVYGAVADPTLLARLNIKSGAEITVGGAKLRLRAALASEPDKLADGIGFGPRLMVSDAALKATGLVQPGSLVHWHYKLKLPPGHDSAAAVKSVVDQAKAQLPQAGWGIRTRTKASPQLQRNVERFTQFLTIVGLTALLVGGVGVGNAVKSHLDRRRETIATLKALGAGGGRVFSIYLLQVLLLALFGGLIGVALGALLPFAVTWLFQSIIPLPIEPAFFPGDLALALLYGLLTALAFALWPLGRAHDVPVGELFRDEVTPQPRRPRLSYMALTAAAAFTLAALAILLAYDRRVAVIYVATAAAVFVLLRGVAWLVMAIARRAPHARATSLRMAVANIHRPGALTPSVVLSLGLGIALLVTVVEIDGNLTRQFSQELPAKAPSFYFLDIPSTQAPQFTSFLHKQAPSARLEDVPMLRGRIVSANGIAADKLKPADDARWVLQSDRGITYADHVPEGSRLTAGHWWKKDYDGPPLVSFEQHIAEGLGLTLGDTITVNILGRNITATIANLRRVDWQNLGINFVMVFSPNAVRGAPHTHLATLTLPNGG
ncbi:MAG TPA: FtsX-like permease family protein, partial [Pseudolabrys sp.]|nr:FtsX-like permease family protein [Pseudolabrys sp.]